MRFTIVILLCALAIGCGYGSKATTPPSPAATPTITQLNPASVIANSGSFMLEVDGANFASNAVINFNGTDEVTTWVTGSKLTATVPNTAISAPGSVPVKVTNQAIAGGLYGGGTIAVPSQPMTFTIN